MNVLSALVGSSDVREDGDLHADEARDDRGEATDEEGNGGVELAELDLCDGADDDCEEDEEDAEEDILLL